VYAVFTAASNAVRLLVLGGMLAWSFTSFVELTQGFFLAPVLVLALAGMWALLPLRTARGPGGEDPGWAELARYTAPIALLQGVAILIMRAANFILNAQAPEEAVARYEIAYQVAFVFPVLTRALFTVLLPEVSAMTTHAEMNRYRNRVMSLSPVVLVLTGAACLAVPPMAGLLLGGTYRDAAPIMQVLLLSLGLGLIYNPLSVLFYALGKPGYNTLIHVVQLVVLVPLDLLLIARYEGMGAAWGWVIITVLALVAAWAWTGSLLNKLRERERGAGA
jgi:O-antigen/teichoic acid export membrane protein